METRSLQRRNPGAAAVYTSPAATETFPAGTAVPNVCGGFGVVTIAYPVNGLQNGPNDGFALVNAGGTVVQLLSYQGAFTAASGATGGPAAGQTSANLPVSESGSTPVGASVHLIGTGSSITISPGRSLRTIRPARATGARHFLVAKTILRLSRPPFRQAGLSASQPTHRSPSRLPSPSRLARAHSRSIATAPRRSRSPVARRRIR